MNEQVFDRRIRKLTHVFGFNLVDSANPFAIRKSKEMTGEELVALMALKACEGREIIQKQTGVLVPFADAHQPVFVNNMLIVAEFRFYFSGKPEGGKVGAILCNSGVEKMKNLDKQMKAFLN